MPERGRSFYYPSGASNYQRSALRAASAGPDFYRERSVFSPVSTVQRALSVARDSVNPPQLYKSLEFSRRYWDTQDAIDRSRRLLERIDQYRMERALDSARSPYFGSYVNVPRRYTTGYTPLLYAAYPYSSYYSPYLDPYFPYSSVPYRSPYYYRPSTYYRRGGY